MTWLLKNISESLKLALQHSLISLDEHDSLIKNFHDAIEKKNKNLFYSLTESLNRLKIETKNFEFDFQIILDSQVTNDYNVDETVVDEHLFNIVESLSRNSTQVIHLKMPLTFDKSKMICNILFEKTGGSKLTFCVGNSIEIEGKITAELFPGEMKEYILAHGWIANAPVVRMIGESSSQKDEPLLEIKSKLHAYELTSGYKKYVLLSEKKIDYYFVKVKGMAIPLNDKEKLNTSEKKVNVTKDLIYVNELSSDEETINEATARVMTASWDYERLFQEIFGLMRHPDWFERFTAAWLFSGKVEGKKLHVGILAPSGTGKTRGIIYPLSYQFQEDAPEVFFEGSGSTFKALIPNYGGERADGGYFARCKRISYVDEFIRCVMRGVSLGKLENNDVGALTGILESKPQDYYSGKTKPILVRPTAKMLIVSNFIHKCPDFVSFAQTMQAPFMARLIWYVQNEQHIKMIQRNQNKIMALKDDTEAYPKPNKEFLKVYDFLNSVRTTFDINEIQKIWDKYRDCVPSDCHEMYDSRYKRHLCCLLDGLIKTKWVVNKRQDFNVRPEDYVELEEIYATIIASWISEIDFSKLPIKVRKNYLEVKDRDFFDLIDKSPMITRKELEEIHGAKPDYYLSKLERVELIKRIELENEVHFIPYWYTGKRKEEKDTLEFLENLKVKE